MNGTSPTLEAFWSSLVEQHDLVRASLEDLPQEALDYRTEHVRNSIVVLVHHIVGSEGFWVGEVVAGVPQDRNRKAEFEARGVAAEKLRTLIDAREAATRKFLDDLPGLDLAAVRTARGRRPEQVTVAWALQHVLTHTAYHAGQVSVLRRIWLDRNSS